MRNNTIIFYITENARNLAQRLKGLYLDADIIRFKSEAVLEIWNKSKNLIFIMATGIVVRTIAPLIKHKKTDPAVVVLDEKGKYAVSLLSGHVGGANQSANDIANFLGGQAVITSAQLYLRPKNLVIGIGCNSGTSADEIENAVKTVLEENNLSFLSIHSIATIDIKGTEEGLKAFAKKYNFTLNTFTADELNTVEGVQKSEAVFKAIGANAVSEPAALLASGASELLVPKQKKGNVTVAIAETSAAVRQCGGTIDKKIPETTVLSHYRTNTLYIVGTGPGSIEHITPYAQDAIRKSDVIVGYGTYLDLIQELIKGKEVVSTGMTQEIDRCSKAVELAMSGKIVSVISGGDPGIYAMAGLVLEILKDEAEKWGNGETEIKKRHKTETSPNRRISDSVIQVEVVPGISALNACAARLGAPLMHDFAAISLSDRLTPWELIEKRLAAAAAGDFVTIIYNPKSMGRQRHIEKARDIILKHRAPKTPVGIVKGAMRENENIIITNLKDMLNYDIDMQTTLIIGNSMTFTWNNYMITPRGYEKKWSNGVVE